MTWRCERLLASSSKKCGCHCQIHWHLFCFSSPHYMQIILFFIPAFALPVPRSWEKRGIPTWLISSAFSAHSIDRTMRTEKRRTGPEKKSGPLKHSPLQTWLSNNAWIIYDVVISSLALLGISSETTYRRLNVETTDRPWFCLLKMWRGNKGIHTTISLL